MFNPSFNTKNTHPSDDNIRKSRENFPSFGPFFAQGSLPLRSKSTNIMNIPLKSYMGNMEGANSSRVDPVNPRTKVPTPSASTRK